MITRRTLTFALLICLNLLSHFSSAQSAFGLRLYSPQFSNFTNRVGVYLDPANSKYQQKSLVGVLMGASFRIKVKNQHYIHTELLYSMRGESYKYTTYSLNGSSVYSINGSNSSLEYYLDYRTHYIEIPIMYCIDLTHSTEDSPVKVFVSSGVSTGINVVSNLSQNNFTSQSGWGISAIDEHSTKTNISGVNPVILNFLSDVEFEFHRVNRKTKYFAYGRYNHSITNVYSHNSPNMNTKVVTYGFGFGFRWYLKS